MRLRIASLWIRRLPVGSMPTITCCFAVWPNRERVLSRRIGDPVRGEGLHTDRLLGELRPSQSSSYNAGLRRAVYLGLNVNLTSLVKDAYAVTIVDTAQLGIDFTHLEHAHERLKRLMRWKV